jgi:hypothetical protein
MFVSHGETHNYVYMASMSHINNILRDITFLNSAAEITTYVTVVKHYTPTLVSFKYWCLDSLKMVEFPRNM